MNRYDYIKVMDVKKFWEENPLCASDIPYQIGSLKYLNFYDKMRELNEPLDFSYTLHEYKSFRNKRVLDVGCGNGYVLSKYAKEGAKAYGLDLTRTGIDLSLKRFDLNMLPGNFTVGNAEELPYPNGIFDCVCSMGVLHHTPNPLKAVSEIYRVIKPGGRLIIMVYNSNSALYRFNFLIRSWLTGKSRQQLVNEVDGLNNPKGDVFSKDELKRLLSLN